jgi:hypothetical protein
MNYDQKTGTPYHIFLDLIGYSLEEYGSNLFNYTQYPQGFGLYGVRLFGGRSKGIRRKSSNRFRFYSGILMRQKGASNVN